MPSVDAASRVDASRGDDPTEWTQHLCVPAERAVVKLAGCTVAAAAPPTLPFWRAVEHGDLSRLEALLEAGEPIDQPGGPYGSTALGWAALSGNVALAQLCLSRGAKPDAKARKGSTPLHMATWNGDYEEIVAMLLEAGADPTATNASGLSPLASARYFDSLERQSSAPSVFEMEEWRAKWGKPPLGRAGVIAKLAAAAGAAETGEAEEEEGTVEKGVKAEEVQPSEAPPAEEDEPEAIVEGMADDDDDAMADLG